MAAAVLVVAGLVLVNRTVADNEYRMTCARACPAGTIRTRVSSAIPRAYLTIEWHAAADVDAMTAAVWHFQ